MATAPSSAKSVSSGTKAGGIGTVKTIVGTVTATDASGVQRTLQVGDTVYANDVIMTSAAGAVFVEFVDGSHVDLGRNSQIALDNEVFSPTAAVAEQSVESIQAQIAAGVDPTQVTDPTAAGPGAPAGNEGHTFVSVAQNAAQGEVTSGFDTTGIGGSIIQAEGDDALPVQDTPTVDTVVPGNGTDVSGNTVPEGIPLVYTVGLTGPTAVATTYAFALGGGTASPADYIAPVFSNGVTYDPVAGTVTVPAGISSFTVTVGTVVDNVYEGPETLPLTVGGVTGTGVITDSNVPTISTVEPGLPGVGDDSVPEGTPLVFNVGLTNASTTATVFSFNLGGGTASPNDYTAPTFNNGVTYNAANGTISVPAGVTEFAVTVGTVIDSIYEQSETLPLTVGGVTGIGTITDTNVPTVTTVEPGQPGVSDDSVPEGTPLVYNVTLSNASTTPTSFSFNLGGGTATPDDYTTPTFSDGVTYNAATGQITVPAGVTEFAVTVGTVIDSVYEQSETLPLTIGGVTGTGFITDTNVPTITTVEPGLPGVGDDSVPEGTNLVYNVSLSNASTTPTSFAFTLGGGSGIGIASPNDYTAPTFSNGVTYDAATGQITVPAGVTEFAVTVGTVIDSVYEQSETLPLTIGGVTGIGTITDTNVPTITTVEPGLPGVGDDSVPEGTNLVYNVTLSNASTTPTSFSFNLGGGTASPNDYTAPTFNNGVIYNAATGQLTVPAGVTEFAVTVGTVIDSVYEQSETLPLTIGGVTGTGFITDTNVPTITTVEPGQPGVSDDSVPEGTNLVYNVTLSNASTTPTSFSFNLGGGTASPNDYTAPTFNNGVTYNAATGQVTVPAGVTEFAVTVGTVIDSVYEQSETLPLTIGGVTGTGFITDTNVPTITTVEPGQPGVSDDSVPEGTNLVYNVTLSNASTTPTSFSFNLGGGTASPNDYTAPTFNNGVTYNAATGQVTVPAGVTEFAVTVGTVIDSVYEQSETLPLTIGGVTGTGFITDTNVPTITTVESGLPGVSDDSVPEGTPLVYNVTLSNASTTPTSFSFNLGGGTASPNDYTAPTFNNGVTYNAATGQVTVPAGVTEFAVTVGTVIDSVYEQSETLPLTIGGVTGTGFITDTNVPTITTVEPGLPGVSDDSVPEGTPLVYNVTLSNASTTPTSFSFNLGGGTASPNDYTAPTFNNGVTYNAATGQVTVPAGVTEFAVTVGTVIDSVYEQSETLPLTIGGVTGTGFITDTNVPTITTVEPGLPGVGDDSVPEGTPLVFNVTLSNASTTPTSFSFNLGGGTASPNDYTAPTFNNGVTYNAATGQVTVPAGVTEFAVTVGTVIDSVYEQSETLPLTIGGVTGTGIITDSNVPTITTVEPGQPGVSDDSVPEGTPLVYNVTLSNASTTPTSFSFNLGGGTASPNDYTAPTFNNGVTYDAATGQITVPAGVTEFAVTVGTVIDNVYEQSETLPLTIGGVTGTGFITDTNVPTITTVEPGLPGVGDDSVPEGTPLVYNVSLSNASTTPTSFSFNLGGGTASPNDYTAPTFNNGVTYNSATGQIIVPAGVTEFAVTVGTVIDNVYEQSETLPLTIGGVTGTGIITDTNVPTIKTVEPGLPGVSDDSVPEGTPLVFNVSLTNASTTPTTFSFNLGGGTASPNDYTAPTFNNGVTYNAANGTVTVPAGVTEFAVTVGTVVDSVYEGPETLPLTVGGVTGTGVITDANVPTITTVEPGLPGVGDDSVPEGTPLVYNVTLSNASTTPTTFSFNLGGGTASLNDYTAPTFNNGVTYNAATGQITVPAGVTSFAVTVGTVIDNVYEQSETLPLTIGGVTGTGIITDTNVPTIKTVEPGLPGVSDDSVPEGTNLVYNVTLTNASTTPTTFSFNLGGGTASPNDYTSPTFNNGVTYNAATGTVTVPAGVTTFAVTVGTVVDNVYENSESLPLTVGGVTGTGFITDTNVPTPSAVVGNTVVEGNNLVYNVTLSNTSTTTTVFNFTLGGQTGTGFASPADYGSPTFTNGVTLNPNGTINVPAGVSSFNVIVPTVDDSVWEPTETLRLNVGSASGIGTIIDNDNHTPTLSFTGTTVSEANLPNGTSPNAAALTGTGSFTVSSPDGISSLTVNGIAIFDAAGKFTPQTISTALNNTLSITGYNASTGEVSYSYKLNGAQSSPGADKVVDNINVQVTDPQGDKASGVLAVGIIDDNPVVPATVGNVVTEHSSLNTNLMIVLDLSGSMDEMVKIGNVYMTRLESAQKAISQMIDAYDKVGDVMVRLVTFSSTAKTMGDGWLTATAAKGLINALAKDAGAGQTNYDAALLLAQTAYNSDASHKIANAQNVSYFISDGAPNAGGSLTGGPATIGIDSKEQVVWESFLKTNNIVSYAVGVGAAGVAASNALAAVAYDGVQEVQLPPILVFDEAALAATLVNNVDIIGTGNLIQSGMLTGNFGADGPAYDAIASITSGAITYNANTTTHNITITSALGGVLTVDTHTGAYTYTSPENVNGHQTDSFKFTVQDADGDKSSAMLNIQVLDNIHHIMTGTDGADTLTGTAQNDYLNGGLGNDILVGGAGDDILIGGRGSDTMTGGAGADVFKFQQGDQIGSTVPNDRITDFNVAQHDVLDLSDLLQGEHKGVAGSSNPEGNLGSFLNFTKDGANTVLEVHTSGSGAVDQKITFLNVDLVGGHSNAQVIQNLLHDGNLKVD